MNTFTILLIIVILLLIYFISIYNKLVKMRNTMQEGFSGIDVQLKKRYDLIPNLVNIVKGFATHEQETFQRVMEARAKAMAGGSIGSNIQDMTKAQSELSGAVSRLLAVAESYPELRSNENFRQLQNELAAVENDIEKSRRYYNATVRENNIAIESFPSNLVAGLGGFAKGEFFELDSTSERTNPTINF